MISFIEIHHVLEENGQIRILHRFQVKASGAALHGQQTIFLTRYQMERNMTKVDIIFENVEDPPSAGIRKFYIQCDCNRVEPVGEIEYIREMRRYNDLQTQRMCFFNHDL